MPRSTRAAWVRWGPAVLVAALAAAPSARALQNEFVGWDDAATFLENPNYRGLGPAQLRWMFTTFRMGHYMPLSWLTWGLDYTFWGVNPLGYHLTNLILHGATALAFYFLALRLLGLAMPDSAETDRRLGAGAAALLWAVHPLRVESVAWATERRDVLSGLFYVSAVIAYLKAVAEPGRRRPGWYWGAVGFFAAALLSKSITVTLAAVLLVLDVYPLRRLGGGHSWLDRDVWREKLPFFALAGTAAVLAFAAVGNVPARPSWQSMGLLPRAILTLHGLGFYVVKTALPLGLSPLYPLDVTISWLELAGVLLGLAAAAAAWRHWPALTAVALVYAMTLLPMSGFFQNGQQSAADRYSYLACLGWALLLGGLVSLRWIGTRVIRAVIAVCLVALMGLSWQQSGVWHDSVTLWRHALSLYPTSRAAHFNLGGAYEERGRYAEALAEYREVLRLSANYPLWYVTIGWAWEKTGVDRGAEQAFREALRLWPGLPDACVGLRRVLERMGKSPETPPGCPHSAERG